MRSQFSWCTCPSCGHKLFKVSHNSMLPFHTHIEIKCHSCKAISDVIFYDAKVKANVIA